MNRNRKATILRQIARFERRVLAIASQVSDRWDGSERVIQQAVLATYRPDITDQEWLTDALSFILAARLEELRQSVDARWGRR